MCFLSSLIYTEKKQREMGTQKIDPHTRDGFSQLEGGWGGGGELFASSRVKMLTMLLAWNVVLVI